jgi:phospholipase/carboxylesterase
VQFGREAEAMLSAGGLEVSYHESDAGHQIDPAHLGPAQSWLAARLLSR